jgi:alpha-glucosidase (family GH31 glycosyl hydrolase)
MKRISLAITLLAAALALYVPAPAGAECPCQKASLDPPFPAWVFGHVVWEDESTTQSVYDLVRGYLERGVPVDAVIIDSPWETAYNTFEVDRERYPDVEKLIADLHRNNIKVIFWITSMVNEEDPEYEFARSHGYFVKGMEARKWWKGTGGMLDYDNPAAVAWWHQRMDKALDLGIDGWKVDGTDPMMLYKGWKRRQDYATKYYSDFYDYTREKTGPKTVAMARPMEQGLNESTLHLPGWLNPLGLGVWLRFAPVDKSFASWVGDQDPTFDGLAIARRHILRSAKEGYLIIGSDVGGYRGPGPDKEVLLRWAQFGALTPFMENGGVGEHRPWMFDAETLKVYRACVLLHKALGPYLYDEAVKAWRHGRSLITPLDTGNEEYLLGKDVLVAPVRRSGGAVRVVLPRGDDWWPLFMDPLREPEMAECRSADPGLLKGGCTFTHRYAISEYPVFLRSGALIPVDVEAAGPLFDGVQLNDESGPAIQVPLASPWPLIPESAAPIPWK